MDKTYCFSCNAVLDLVDGTVGRRNTCDKCGSDTHVCYNCKYYDEKSYNECKEPQAERVLEKDRSNFCDYFSVTFGAKSNQDDSKKSALDALDSLFK